MLAARNQNSTDPLGSLAEENDDSGVPLSERGKGEAMPMDKRHPSWVFAIVGLTFFLLLFTAVVVVMTYLNVTTPSP